MVNLEEENRQLRAEVYKSHILVEELRADVERYRWMKRNPLLAVRFLEELSCEELDENAFDSCIDCTEIEP